MKKPSSTLRGLPSPSTAAAFVGGAARNASTEEAEPRRRKKNIQPRVTKEDRAVFTVYLPATLGKRLRVFSANENMDMSEVFAEALRQLFDRKGG